MDKEKKLWTLTTVIALAALVVSSFYAVRLYDFEMTCKGCIEANHCYITPDFNNITYLNDSNNEFGPLASGYIFANET